MMPITKTEPNPVFDDVDKWVGDALRRPDSFAMFDDDPKMFVTWSLGPVIEHRDSDSIQRANAIALKKALEEDPELKGWRIIGCSHWAVGHVDHLAFQVLTKMTKEEMDLVAEHKTPATGHMVLSRPGFKLTRIALFVKQWFDNLEEYPIADEDELGKLELEESLETIQQQASSCLRGTELALQDNLPDDWFMKVFAILDRQGAISHSSGGAWAEEDKLLEALKKLKYTKPENGP